MPEITATIIAKSAYGVKITDDGDWMNWSKDEFRGEPFNTEVQKGDRVQITYAESDSGKVFITTIDKVVAGDVRYAKKVTGPVVLGSGNEPIDNAFPPDEDFPPDDVQQLPEPVLDKDHSIVRQTCIKAACVALQHNMGNAEEKAGMITYLAGVMEDWCWR